MISHSGQLSLLISAMENEYRPNCGDALQLGSKGRYGSLQLWINMRMAGKTCDPLLTNAIPEQRLEMSCELIKHYTNRHFTGAVVQRVRHLGLRSVGRRFKSCSGQCCVTNLRQVVYIYVPLSPRSITWYRPKGGDALRLGR